MCNEGCACCSRAVSLAWIASISVCGALAARAAASRRWPSGRAALAFRPLPIVPASKSPPSAVRTCGAHDAPA